MTACATCAHADEHGWWGPTHEGHTHCRRCHGSWPVGTDMQHCTLCCRTFTNIRAADLHRARGTGACLDPATILDLHHRPRLALSHRRRGPGTTVTIWALAEHRESRLALRVPRESASGTRRRVPTPASPESGLTQDSPEARP